MEFDLNIPNLLLIVAHVAREFLAISALISALLCLLTGSRRFEHGGSWWPFYGLSWVFWLVGTIGLAAPILSPAASLPFAIPGNNLLVMQVVFGITGGFLVSTILVHRPIQGRYATHYW